MSKERRHQIWQQVAVLQVSNIGRINGFGRKKAKTKLAMDMQS